MTTCSGSRLPNRHAGAQRYYTEGLVKQDYLSEGQEVTGQWFGHGAEMLGLSELTAEAISQADGESSIPGRRS